VKRFIPLALVAGAIFAVLLVGSFKRQTGRSDQVQDLKRTYARKHVPSVDHKKFAILQKKFASAHDVTPACISCHTERHKEVMASTHWNWSREVYLPGRGIRTIGKKNLLNNFCIGVSSNLQGCSKCHAGYEYVDNGFDFTDARNVDCLVCHDNSGTYTKTTAGMPSPDVDLNFVSQRVGPPQRANCGTCHFFGGGGNNVKHGDLEQALMSTTRDVDVHMGTDGSDLDCVACHTGKNHKMLGKMYSVSSMNRDRSTCEQCHGATPHTDSLLNEHTVKLACQTCHIPVYAKANETKMAWDWSTAGKLRDGKPYEVEDADGNPTYASIKGNFIWRKNVRPEYIFFNGTADHYLVGDTVQAGVPVQMNTLHGSYDDPNSKIIPVKIHRAKQIYDPVNKILIQPKLSGGKKGDGAFWQDFDWNTSAAAGMKSVGLPYSGHYAFIDTVMYWPVNHMVATKEKTVACVECHAKHNSRLAGLGGFYMPGRDRNSVIEWLGRLALLGALAGALLHAAARIVMSWRRRAA
jgi:octaheme c-type cytochrome (tetrathionate reductase family)